MLLRICSFTQKKNTTNDWDAIPKDKVNQLTFELVNINLIFGIDFVDFWNNCIVVWSKELELNLVDLVNMQASAPHQLVLYCVHQDKFVLLDDMLEKISPKLLKAFGILVSLDDELYDAELLTNKP